ncbi:MAG: low molecular weight protein-tyrosine-phosphatase [Acutalibacteraceae bacterium]|nr:low molecular weight protein-tyrosine-phosphatase [Acutalibacteraceae bacterium]
MKILFVCLGNICRSAMAHYMFKDYCHKNGIENVYIDSAGTSDEEAGNPIYPPARAELLKHGIRVDNHRARKIRAEDYEKFDLILCAEQYQCRRCENFFGGDKENKIMRMLDITDTPSDIADPWYSGDFTLTYNQLTAVCEKLAKMV